MECDNGYDSFQTSCYKLSDTGAPRADAAVACKPGHLVDIASKEEQDFVATILSVNFGWHDKPCDEKYKSICEYEGIHFTTYQSYANFFQRLFSH